MLREFEEVIYLTSVCLASIIFDSLYDYFVKAQMTTTYNNQGLQNLILDVIRLLVYQKFNTYNRILK